MAENHAYLQTFVGRTLRKDFAGLGTFTGIIKAVDEVVYRGRKLKCLMVVYPEDGDREHLTVEEVSAHLCPVGSEAPPAPMAAPSAVNRPEEIDLTGEEEVPVATAAPAAGRPKRESKAPVAYVPGGDDTYAHLRLTDVDENGDPLPGSVAWAVVSAIGTLGSHPGSSAGDVHRFLLSNTPPPEKPPCKSSIMQELRRLEFSEKVFAVRVAKGPDGIVYTTPEALPGGAGGLSNGNPTITTFYNHHPRAPPGKGLKRKKFPAAPVHRHAPDSCHVCMAEFSWDGNEILICDGCDVMVHQECYGVHEIPEGDWFCAACLADLPKDGSNCALCPTVGGAVKPMTIGSCWETRWTHRGHPFVHVACALWVPEFFFPNPEDLSPIDAGRYGPTHPRAKLYCEVCGELGGAVQCSIKGCHTAFHVLCGRENHHVAASRESDGELISFCCFHSGPGHSHARGQVLSLSPEGEAATRARDDRGDLLAQNAGMRAELGAAAGRRATFLRDNWSLFAPFLPRPQDQDPKGPLAAKACAAAPAQRPGPSSLPGVDGKTPPYIKATLRPYQMEGLSWLVGQHDKGAGSILGDEMGLGKTLQVISFLAFLKHSRGEGGPHLVVAPLSVMPTWMSEIKRWCPSLRAFAFHGPQAERDRLKHQMRAGEFDVLCTTYEMLLAEENSLRSRFHFRYIVLDEAQRIKNDQSLLGQAVRHLRCVGRLLLTGTPLQNNLRELWSLLNFLYPDVLDSSCARIFEGAFSAGAGGAAGADKGLVRATHRLLAPLMLRRTKAEVLTNEIPPKREVVVPVGMSQVQRDLYAKILKGEEGLFGKLSVTWGTSEDAPAGGEGGGEAAAPPSTNKFKQLNNVLMQLRKCCCHPYLFPGLEPEPFQTGEHLVEASGKLKALDEMLARLLPGGHKVLIFSQFTKFLDVISDYLELRGLRYLRLDGSTSLARRRYETALFNRADSGVSIYLISTKAGGLGLNLQTADTVIIADQDWNPTGDLQAQDRAHRIGQLRPVTVYRLVTTPSAEERMLVVANTKMDLAKAVLAKEGDDVADDGASGGGVQLSMSELASIVTHGVDKIRQGGGSAAGGDVGAANVAALMAKEEASGALGMAEAAERMATSAKAALRDWGGSQYKKEGPKDIADFWASSVSGKRQRRSTVQVVDTHEAGLGRQEVSRWSILEAERTRRAEANAKLEREAKAARAPRIPKHDTSCVFCSGDGPVPLERVAAERHERWGLRMTSKNDPTKNSGWVGCSLCPQSAHAACARVNPGVPRAAGMAGWRCPAHRCKACDRTPSNAGGLLFRCVGKGCGQSSCFDCLTDDFEAIPEHPTWEALGFHPGATFEYIKCPSCLPAAELN